MEEQWRKVLENECLIRGIRPQVIEAIIKVESADVVKSARYERNFFFTYKVESYAKLHKITVATEKMFQKCSWGLMQLMGGTARWAGFTGWLPDLLEPEQNLYWGCEYFRKVCLKYINVNDQISVYNAGSVRRKSDGRYLNQEYVDKVMALLPSAFTFH